MKPSQARTLGWWVTAPPRRETRYEEGERTDASSEKVSMKRFWRAMPLILVAGVAVSGCGSVDVNATVHSLEDVTLSVKAKASAEEIKKAEAESAAFAQSGGAQPDPNTFEAGSDGLGKQLNTVSIILTSMGLHSTGSSLESKNTAEGQEATLSLRGVSAENLSGVRSKADAALQQYAGSAANGKSVEQLSQDENFIKALQQPSNYPAVVAAALPVVTQQGERYRVELSPRFVKVLQGANAELSVTLPRAVEEADGAGVISGHTVTWKASDLKDGQTVSAVSAGPGMAWWLSAILWVLGVLVVVLLIVLTLTPKGPKEPKERKGVASQEPSDESAEPSPDGKA